MTICCDLVSIFCVFFSPWWCVLVLFTPLRVFFFVRVLWLCLLLILCFCLSLVTATEHSFCDECVCSSVWSAWSACKDSFILLHHTIFVNKAVKGQNVRETNITYEETKKKKLSVSNTCTGEDREITKQLTRLCRSHPPQKTFVVLVISTKRSYRGRNVGKILSCWNEYPELLHGLLCFVKNWFHWFSQTFHIRQMRLNHEY